MAQPLLDITGLELILSGADHQPLPVLQDINLQLAPGECLGIAGESGSGKSILAMALLGLLPKESVKHLGGKVIFDGIPLLELPEHRLRSLRGSRMAMVFQEPMTAMNPLMTLYDQIAEVVEAHEHSLSGKDVRKKVEHALQTAGFSEPEKYWDSYPHQLSGGMKQRAMLGMALVMDPDLVIADEPTTALDAALQIQLLAELRALVKNQGRALIFISHDLGVIRSIADRLVILYAGQIMESGCVADVLERSAHPYTSALVAAMPRLVTEKKLPKAIPGHLPSPDRKSAACVFFDRCRFVQDDCRATRPALSPWGGERMVRCFHPLGAPLKSLSVKELSGNHPLPGEPSGGSGRVP